MKTQAVQASHQTSRKLFTFSGYGTHLSMLSTQPARQDSNLRLLVFCWVDRIRTCISARSLIHHQVSSTNAQLPGSWRLVANFPPLQCRNSSGSLGAFRLKPNSCPDDSEVYRSHSLYAHWRFRLLFSHKRTLNRHCRLRRGCRTRTDKQGSYPWRLTTYSNPLSLTDPYVKVSIWVTERTRTADLLNHNQAL